jgi:D-proline reductase (dithiol) PrdB
MEKTVDSYRFLDGLTKRMTKTWAGAEKPRKIPWTPLRKPLAECTVALISSAGIALKTDRPFDREGERQNPWWGDPSYRIIPAGATEQDVRLYHMHIDPHYAEQDLNCLFPLQRLSELAELGEIGRSAARHYSMMGYLLKPDQFLAEAAPSIVAGLAADKVDAVILAPA